MKKDVLKKEREKSNELGLYAIVGAATILLNIGLLAGLTAVGVDYRVSNLIAIISSKVFGYVGNKKIVFKSHCANRKELWVEIWRFVLTRGFTGVVDYVGLIIAVQLLGANLVVSKCILEAIVIVINYLTGKFMVFKKKPKEEIELLEENMLV